VYIPAIMTVLGMQLWDSYLNNLKKRFRFFIIGILNKLQSGTDYKKT